jgi:hypothetical protein
MGRTFWDRYDVYVPSLRPVGRSDAVGVICWPLNELDAVAVGIDQLRVRMRGAHHLALTINNDTERPTGPLCHMPNRTRSTASRASPGPLTSTLAAP